MRKHVLLRNRRSHFVVLIVSVAVGLAISLSLTASGKGFDLLASSSNKTAAGDDIGDVSLYPKISGGRWVRGPNLVDAKGRFQARQEHAAVRLNGFVYLIGGFVPIRPAPEPTVDQPEPFPFEGTGDVLVYTPEEHPNAPATSQGKWASLPAESAFPVADMHHIVAVRHHGRIWAFGGHSGEFAPTSRVFVFTPDNRRSPEGTWSRVSVLSGRACSWGSGACLRLPNERAAGAAVSIGDRIYLLGGVEPYENSPDPVNASIRTTNSVIYLDTNTLPLRWRVAPGMHDPREHFNAIVRGDRIYVFHGRNEVSTHMRAVESWAPGDPAWRQEQDAPVGTSANILAAVRNCVYSFGGEFIASNVTGTLTASQVFHLPSGTWRRLESAMRKEPLDASGATNKHGTYGVAFTGNGTTKIMAPGGAATAWFDPMSKVHIFTPPDGCT